MLYSTFQSVENTQATLVESDWAEFATRLSQFIVTESKKSVGLFNGTVFKGTGRRLMANADVVHLFILDIDNSRPLLDDAGKPMRDENNKLITVMVEAPVAPEVVAAMLDGYAYVIVTSYSHTDEWPRFRLVLPLEAPIPANKWSGYAQGVVAQLGLDIFGEALDDCYKTPVQSYYWPAHPAGRPGVYLSGEGSPLAATVQAPVTTKSAKVLEHNSPFTEDQIVQFWSEVFTEPEDASVFAGDDVEMKFKCPLHGGSNRKFYVNRHTGLWKCWSKCKDLYGEDKRSGDIYRFQELHKQQSFVEAKRAVHKVLGAEPGARYTTEELEALIEVASPEQLDELVPEIAKRPTKDRNALVKQLVTLHPQLEETLPEQVKQQRKVTQLFPGRRDEASAPTDWAEAYAEQLDRQAEMYGLRLAPERYDMDEHGVYAIKEVGKEIKKLERVSPPIADRPIWPATLGNDLATAKVWARLAWKGSDGHRHAEWHPATIMNSREGLLGLNDAPVSLGNVVAVSSFLTYAKTTLVDGFQSITSQVGWAGEGEEQRFVLPDDPTYEYIGTPLDMRGTVAGWAEGLPAILSMGHAGYTALAVLGLAAASPFVRLAHKRNPVLGLVSESSTGKGKTIDYALSIWTTPGKLTVPAGSTIKGTQDIGMDRPDFPLFVDELQQLLKDEPKRVEDLVYFMGNGQRRVTSSKAQTAKGGERRYGVCFFAAEQELMVALQRGAQNRVIELDGKPLRDSAMAGVLQSAATNNCGAVGREIANILNHDSLLHMAEIEYEAVTMYETHPALKGDDPYTIAFIQQGLRLLSEVTGVKLPAEKVADWLKDFLCGNRSSARDTSEDMFVYLMEAILSMPWGMGGPANCLMDPEGFIAWRMNEATSPDDAPLEINPTAGKVADLLRRKNQTDGVARQWAKKGWIVGQNKNLKWMRGATRTGAGARVWRITPEGLALVGLNAQFEPLI